MKLIIDIEPRYCKYMYSDVKELYYEAINRITEAVRNGKPYEERPQGQWVRKEEIIHLLERWSDGYSYIEIPTDDAIKAIKELNE